MIFFMANIDKLFLLQNLFFVMSFLFFIRVLFGLNSSLKPHSLYYILKRYSKGCVQFIGEIIGRRFVDFCGIKIACSGDKPSFYF